MRYTYSSLYLIRGLSPWSPPRAVEIFSDPRQNARAVLTSEPALLCDQLDRSAALLSMLLTGLTGDNDEAGSVDDRLVRQVERLREERAKKYGAGVYLFWEASGETPKMTPSVERDCGTFILALNGLPKGDIRRHHEPLVRKILAAISLGIAGFAGFKKVSDATVFLADDGKPLYSFNVEGHISEILVSRPASAKDFDATCELAICIVKTDAFDRVIRLLNESVEAGQEKLRRFLSAWMALELFVNENFNTYAKKFWDSLSAGVSAPIRERYLKRIHEVMRDKYRLLDRFVVISAALNPTDADTDVQTFQRAKRLRDEFLHGKPIDEDALPLQDVQSLVRKFLRLHVTRS